MPTPTGWGSEFLVNTTTSDAQFQPTIAALDDGRFVIAWNNQASKSLRAQLFNADGTRADTEINITTTYNSFNTPRLAAFADGRFVIGWTDYRAGGIPNASDVFAQIFNIDGTRTGPEIPINTTTSAYQNAPVMVELDDGRFVIAWNDNSGAGADAFGNAIRAQVFSRDGNIIGPEFLVNTTFAGDQFGPNIAALADGHFVIVWNDFSQSGGDPSGYAVRAQLFNSNASKFGAEFLVNTTTTSNQMQSTITALADGRFVITWIDNSLSNGDISAYEIRAQLFNIDGSRDGLEFLVNSTTTSLQFSPTIASFADGRFVIAWSDDSRSGGDTDGAAIRAQVFNADGSRDGLEFLVNTTVSGDQREPAITTLADGRFVIAWTDYSQTGGDPSDSAVRSRIFDPRNSAVNLIAAFGVDSDFVGTLFADEMLGADGNDRFRGAAGDDRLSGNEGDDNLFGDAGNDALNGDNGNDTLSGGTGSDRLNGDSGNDVLDGGIGADRLVGGIGNDTFVVDSRSDRLIETATGGRDEVRSASISLDLSLAQFANVENARLLGSTALNLSGNASANSLTGNAASNILRGGAGADILTGADAADTFVLDSPAAVDRITDFSSGSDRLSIPQSGIAIGNGDAVIDGGVLRHVPGGFASTSELVIFSNGPGGVITTAKAAATIGSAQAAYTVGDTRLFAVGNGVSSRLFLFTAANADAVVSAAELTLLADLTPTPALALADLQFSR